MNKEELEEKINEEEKKLGRYRFGTWVFSLVASLVIAFIPLGVMGIGIASSVVALLLAVITSIGLDMFFEKDVLKIKKKIEEVIKKYKSDYELAKIEENNKKVKSSLENGNKAKDKSKKSENRKGLKVQGKSTDSQLTVADVSGDDYSDFVPEEENKGHKIGFDISEDDGRSL